MAKTKKLTKNSPEVKMDKELQHLVDLTEGILLPGLCKKHKELWDSMMLGVFMGGIDRGLKLGFEKLLEGKK